MPVHKPTQVLTYRNYYLGVSSSAAAFKAVNELSFCRVLNRNTGEVRITGADRIRLVVVAADRGDVAPGTDDTMVWLGGSFTQEEIVEIERLARHSDPRALKKVEEFAARAATQVSGSHRVLGQQ